MRFIGVELGVKEGVEGLRVEEGGLRGLGPIRVLEEMKEGGGMRGGAVVGFGFNPLR